MGSPSNIYLACGIRRRKAERGRLYTFIRRADTSSFESAAGFTDGKRLYTPAIKARSRVFSQRVFSSNSLISVAPRTSAAPSQLAGAMGSFSATAESMTANIGSI